MTYGSTFCSFSIRPSDAFTKTPLKTLLNLRLYKIFRVLGCMSLEPCIRVMKSNFDFGSGIIDFGLFALCFILIRYNSLSLNSFMNCSGLLMSEILDFLPFLAPYLPNSNWVLLVIANSSLIFLFFKTISDTYGNGCPSSYAIIFQKELRYGGATNEQRRR